jgi:hypothetical protein
MPRRGIDESTSARSASVNCLGNQNTYVYINFEVCNHLIRTVLFVRYIEILNVQDEAVRGDVYAYELKYFIECARLP